MERALSCSRASQLRNGEITSPQLHTWDWEHIWDTSSVRMDEDTFLVTSKILEMIQRQLTGSESTEQMLGRF